MTNNTDFLTIILYVMLGIMAVLAVVLVFIYMNMKVKEKKALEEQNKLNVPETKEPHKQGSKTYNVASVFDFMEFDKIEDNMIIQKKGARYIMAIECQGINYDLMSQAEKVAVEEGFIQFLNTLSHPVQIYTQTRKINLESSIQTYKAEVDKIEQEYNRQKIRYQNIVASPTASNEQKQQALYEFTKDRNLYEYGKDIIYNTEKMSLNKNILNKKYYIRIPYFSEELGQNDFDKDEIKEMAFSELYTRAQSIIRTLAVSGVIGRVLSSTELADLLYFAYNRDDAEVYGVDKAIKASHKNFLSIEEWDAQILKCDDSFVEAMKLANEKVIQAQTEKQREYQRKVETEDDIINNLAQLIIQENEAMIGKDIAEKAKEKVRKERKTNVKQKATE